MRKRTSAVVYALVFLTLIAAGPCRTPPIAPPPTTPAPDQPIVPAPAGAPDLISH